MDIVFFFSQHDETLLEWLPNNVHEGRFSVKKSF
jgi:hypothetical protein